MQLHRYTGDTDEGTSSHSEFNTRGWSLSHYQLKWWIHGLPKAITEGWGATLQLLWTVGWWISAHSHWLPFFYKKGEQAPLVGRSSGIGLRMDISGPLCSGTQVKSRRVWYLPISIWLLLSLSWIRFIRVLEPFPTPSAFTLDRILPVVSSTLVSEVGLKQYLTGMSMTPSW